MRVFRHFPLFADTLKHPVLALGNFDGVHLGHQAVLNTARALADTTSSPFAVMTFEPHPRRFFKPDLPHLRILSWRQKIEKLEKAGADAVLMARFNAALAGLSAEAFIEELLVNTLGVSHVVTGDDFVFGKGRQGSGETLTNAAQKGMFGYTRAASVMDAGMPVSSTRIREALSLGGVQEASQLLGETYAICGRVVHGHKRGRGLGYPTANLSLARLFVPRHGVYAVEVESEGERFKGVANLGVRPTFGGSEPVLEVHALESVGDLYGLRLRVACLHFLREERTFDNAAALKAQIARDVAHARQLLGIS